MNSIHHGIDEVGSLVRVDGRLSAQVVVAGSEGVLHIVEVVVHVDGIEHCELRLQAVGHVYVGHVVRRGGQLAWDCRYVHAPHRLRREIQYSGISGITGMNGIGGGGRR